MRRPFIVCRATISVPVVPVRGHHLELEAFLPAVLGGVFDRAP